MRKFISLSFTALLAAFATLFASVTHAQVVIAPTTPQIGSSNPATAAPLVPRPHTKPCVVQLFQNLAFEDFTPKVFNYAPPSNCPGPWAKVVFTADFTVTEGRQFDRTAAFYLGHANIYYGTTAEPRATLSPSWHVEHDVTDLSAIFKSDQTGEANLGNIVDSTYTGIIYANAALEFYPASFRDPAPRVPDIVVPVNGPGGDAGTLNTTTDQITQTTDLPTNVEKVYLDVIAQSQIGDEFWYLCVPSDNNLPTKLESCGNTAFRETEISIDGKPAGVAPVYPWIYTGGIDPGFWEPIPGNQTLDFKPYRVDLTPFAGVLGDGGTHTVAVSVFNANGYFLATANLLVFTDHGSAKDAGGLISNTLSSAPTPFVKENIKTNPTGPTYTGTVLVGSNREFTIKGYVNTSHGRVVTTIHQSVNFLSNQHFNVSPTVEIQNAEQSSTVDSETRTQDGPFLSTNQEHFSYPLNIDYKFVANTDGTFTQTASVNQQFLRDTAEGGFGSPFFASSVSEQTKAQDTLELSPSFSITAFVNPSSSQSYRYQNSRGDCYSRTIKSSNLVLTGVSSGHGCQNQNQNQQ